jgi:hypothetical protein
VKVLIACEFSGVVREAFKAKGHDAWSCDLLPSSDDSAHHYQRDVSEVLEWSAYKAEQKGKEYWWDLIIAHPPCTYLTVAGNRYYANRPDLYEPAAEFATQFFDYAPMVAVENPIGRLSRLFRKPDQIIQPYDFGEDASKATCLWLKGLPLLRPTKRVAGRMVNGVERWSNQTDSGQNRLPPSEDRGLKRSITPQGIADAMAEQWG